MVYQKPSRNVNTMFCKFQGLFGASEPGESVLRRGCGATIWTDDVDCCGKLALLRSPESREQKLYIELNRAVGAGVLDSINPEAIARARRELRPWRLPLRNRAVADPNRAGDSAHYSLEIQVDQS